MLILSVNRLTLGALISERNATEKRLASEEERTRLLLESTVRQFTGWTWKEMHFLQSSTCLQVLGYDRATKFWPEHAQLLHHTKSDGSVFPFEECPFFKAFVEARVIIVLTKVLWRADGTSFPRRCGLIR